MFEFHELDRASEINNNSIIFIDASLENYRSLIFGTENTEVIVLNRDDSVRQITEVLEQHSNLNSVYIISHGEAGGLNFSSGSLNLENLTTYEREIKSWSEALNDGGDILLYGCNVAAGEVGLAFVDRLSQLTQADVAASNNLTGNAQLGGDWNLEVATGQIESQIALAAMVDYDSVLATYNGNEYQLTSAALTWQQAEAEAVSLGGHLVTINDLAEQRWLASTFNDGQKLWIGLNDRTTEGQFQWTSGQAVNYTNWAPGTPDNFGVGEDFVLLRSDRTWNDVGGNALFQGIIEIGDNNTTVVETFTYNGNQYRLTTGASNWRQAEAEAVSVGGHLVSINDAAEQQWLRNTFGRSERFWIGLNDRNTEGQFQWTNGQAVTYTNWSSGNPDNFGAGEDFVVLRPNGTWNDLGGGALIRGIIEIGAAQNNPGVIGLSDNSFTVNEADGVVEVTVLRTQGSDGTVTVDYRTINASATSGTDYTGVSGTLTFAPGETSKSVSIAITDDSRVEGAENFSFTIDNVTGGATLLAPRTALVEIEDNDTLPNALTYNGNQYFLTSTALTWSQAQAVAENFGGNLVTINDALEEAWLKRNFGETQGFWLGINDFRSEGNFEWASGQPVTYTNWAPGEPNNSGGNQDFGWMNFGTSRQWDDTSPTATFFGIIEIGGSNPAPRGTGNGLRAEYFNDLDFTNTRVIRTDRTVNFNWGSGSPAPAIDPDTFSARWTGQIEARFSENYTFRTTTDDGVRLWVNNNLIIDKFVNQSATNHEGTISLVAGQRYDIKLEYYENAGAAVAQLSWFSNSQALEIVPQSQLYSPITSDRTFTQETVISQLTQPTAIDWSPNGNLLYIAEKQGTIKVLSSGSTNPTTFIDLSAHVNGTRDRGLLDIAVHPDFFNGSPYVYALYTYDPPQVFQNTGLAGRDGNGNRAARLTRITADASTNYTTAVAGSEVVILGKNSIWQNFNAFVNSTFDFNERPAGILADGTNIQDFLAADSESHTIGSVEFGPDGALYVSNGDGTSYNQVDPRTVRVQDINNLSGKILRIDPITGEGLADNPFYNGDPNSNRSKVYQYGLRNPFRITVDSQGGKVYVGDVGWTQWEEINSAPAGANFGWPYYEGGNGTSLQTGGYRDLAAAQAFYASGQQVTSSLLALNHAADGINAIVLGDIYRGNNLPEEYRGDLFFNDLGQGIVRNVSFDEFGNVSSIDTFTTGAQVVVQIVEGPDGSLYYVDLDSGLVGRWRFV
jgi:glucose/arabinose dehydrogenase